MVYLFSGKKRKLRKVGGLFPQCLLRASLTSGSGAQGTSRERVAGFCVWIISATLPLKRVRLPLKGVPISLALPLFRQKTKRKEKDVCGVRF